MVSSADGDGDPNCTICHGLGWVSLFVPLDHPRFGKLLPCHGCRGSAEDIHRHMEFEANRKRITRYSGTRSQQTFRSFNPNRITASIRLAFLGARAYAEDPQGWLVLHGNYGTGKSHMASAIANRRADQLVMSLTVPEMLEMLKDGFGDGTYRDLLDLCRTVDLLILDDIGTENPTPWAYEKLFQIINHRYNQQLPTVFILNGKPDDLSPRIASRLSDRDLATIYPMYGDDYRRRKDPIFSPRT